MSCRKRFVCSTWRRCIGEFASKSLRYCSGSRLNGIGAIPVAGADLRSWSREAQPRVRLRQISLHPRGTASSDFASAVVQRCSRLQWLRADVFQWIHHDHRAQLVSTWLRRFLADELYGMIDPNASTWKVPHRRRLWVRTALSNFLILI